MRDTLPRHPDMRLSPFVLAIVSTACTPCTRLAAQATTATSIASRPSPPQPVPHLAPIGPLRGQSPVFPPMFRSAGVEGTVVVRLFVRPDSTVDIDSTRILQSTHPLFTDAVTRALPAWRFRPAQRSPVRADSTLAPTSWTEVTAAFRIVRDSSALAPCRKPTPILVACVVTLPLVERALTH